MTHFSALDIADAYHRAWVEHDIESVTRLLSPTVVIEVPVNAYATRDEFAAAVIAFSAMTKAVTMLDRFAHADTAMQLYDMEVEGLGSLRVAEHFTVSSGVITRIRQIHDTYAVRKAGFAPEGT